MGFGYGVIFLVACPSSNWLSGGSLGDVGLTPFGTYFCAVYITSGLPDDVIIDAHTDGSRTDGHFRVTSDVMGHSQVGIRLTS